MKAIKGGYALSPDDTALRNTQKFLTRQINDKFVQIGATWLKPSSKFPVDGDWYKKNKGDVDLQAWVDDDETSVLNCGFNLQQGWMDVDIDSDDHAYQPAVIAGLRFVGVDTRFAFGRRSTEAPSHLFVQLPEDEARIFEEMRRFEPREWRRDGKRYHTQLRSINTSIKEVNLVKSAKQTVVPGSVYSSKVEGADYDVSVWFTEGQPGVFGPAGELADIAATTARAASFTTVVRGIAFGTVAFLLRSYWVSGQRQSVATRFTGWLARVVADSESVNEHEVISNDVFCPVDSDAIAEQLIKFLAETFGDDEPFMRVRAYHDAREKLQRNPDAKVPGWHSITELLGGESVNALRTVLMPGNDVSKLTQMVDRYVYDESDNNYIDRSRHATYNGFVHGGDQLERRHKGDTILVGGKPREAFKIFESSTLRKRVGFRDMYPDLEPGQIFRIDNLQNVVPDEADVDASVIFNTWKGWPIDPAPSEEADRIGPLIEKLDRLLGLLTRDNPNQIEWFKDWIAWIFQRPGDKQQIAPVIVGDQGVGKSFLGNVFMRALLTERLWSSASPKILEQNFTIGPFKEKMFAFIDEADFSRNHMAVDEIKKLIRNTEISGMEKFEEARNYRIYARLMFASNKHNVGISQRDVRDRALFYMRTYDAAHLQKTEPEFRAWAETLKPYFEDFAEVLRDRANIAAYLRYFLDRPVDRHTLESIRYSSGDDPEIAAANMSWARRVAKGVIESGYVVSEDLAWEMPFDLTQFGARISEEAKRQNLREVRHDAVLAELKTMGILSVVADSVHGMTVRLFKPLKWGEALKVFSTSSGVRMSPYREPDESDMGENTVKHKDRPARRGIKPPLAGKF